jgi:serine protease Do
MRTASGRRRAEATGSTDSRCKPSPEIAAQLRLEDAAKGVVVTRVRPGSPAESARLQQYDLILEVNQTPVASSAEFKTAIQKNPKGALLLVKRGRQEIFVTMRRTPK